jgi:hypothetical protein
MNATTSPTTPTMCSLSTNHICTCSTHPDAYHMSWLPSYPQPARKVGCKYLKPLHAFKLLLTSNIVKESFFLFNPYTMHFCSVYTISQQIHCSVSLLITSYSSYMFRHMYILIRSPSIVCPAELH